METNKQTHKPCSRVAALSVSRLHSKSHLRRLKHDKAQGRVSGCGVVWGELDECVSGYHTHALSLSLSSLSHFRLTGTRAGRRSDQEHRTQKRRAGGGAIRHTHARRVRPPCALRHPSIQPGWAGWGSDVRVAAARHPIFGRSSTVPRACSTTTARSATALPVANLARASKSELRACFHGRRTLSIKVRTQSI
jgi:hypothetical protein